MTWEQVAFRAVVFYEAAALATGQVPPLTHFLMKLGNRGRVAVSVGAGLWMLRHLEVEVFGYPRGRILP